MNSFRQACSAIACLVALAALPGVTYAETYAPRPPGRYAVGCSSVEQDFSRLRTDETAQQYWEGIPASDGRSRYITDLLTNPATPTVSFPVPDDSELYGGLAGKTYTVTLLICYPAAVDVARMPYLLPNGAVVPRMLRGGESPTFDQSQSRWPLLEFSHGLDGSPLDEEYLDAMQVFASNGYIVVAPFHADARVANLDLNDFRDVVDAITNFSDYTALQAARPLALKYTLDYILSQPEWSGHIDFARIAGFGASLGGESLILQAGAKLTVSVGQSSRQVLSDGRLKTIATYVPYFGQPELPAFGRDQSGIDFMNTIPVLGIAGTADDVAPLAQTRQGFERMVGTHVLVSLEGAEHGLDLANYNDIFSWSLVFLDATSQRDPAELAQLQRMTNVAGGADDRIVVADVLPYPPAPGEQDVIEYYNASLDHYFMTADPTEQAILDVGTSIQGWSRTGYVFKSWALNDPRGAPVCRYYGTPGIGPNTHFYSVFANECAILAAEPIWTFEGNVMRTDAPANWTCPAGEMLVVRLYNNEIGGTANHRYTISPDVINEMVDRGWIVEGPVMCTPP